MTTLQLVLFLLGASVVVVTVCHAFRLPAILGYLLVGVLVGPHALDVLPDTEGASHLAEFGVVFLMFSIGLEFSLPRLLAMKRIVFGLGLAQVVATTGLITLFAMLLGQTSGLVGLVGLVLGGALSMSSTAILSKLLADRHELDSPHGRQVMGVLLFQDLAVVPMLIVIPALAQPVGDLAMAVGLAVVKAAALLAVILLFGPRLMHGWFHRVARRKSSELFMLNVLLVTLGLAWLTEWAGLSLALGAFVAGMLISETEYRYRVEEDIKPFRDVLLGLFFISTGMMLNLGDILRNWPSVAGVLTGLLVGKWLVGWLLSKWFGGSSATALRTGLWLCAGGEFGFVLLARGESVGLLAEGPLQPVLAAMVLSLMVAPLLVQISDRLVLRLVASEWLERSMQLTQLAARTLNANKHAILCGYGRTGQHLARLLEQEGVDYVALDFDPDRVREAANAGEPVSYGDCVRGEALLAAGLPRASVVVVTFTSRDSTLRVLDLVNQLAPGVPVVARSREQDDTEELLSAGAAEVVPEALESSVMLATHALAFLGVPLHRIVKSLRNLREQHYGLLRGFFHGGSDIGEHTDDSELPRLLTVPITSSCYACGRQLDDLKLSELGVSVSALRRHGLRGREPDGTVVLVAGDVLVVLGASEALKRGKQRLMQGPE